MEPQKITSANNKQQKQKLYSPSLNTQYQHHEQHELKPETSQQEPNVILIRHGQSCYNLQAQHLRKKLGIGATWQQYKANPQFMKFKYSEQMMDTGLSQKGIEQCMKMKKFVEQSMQKGEIGLVLVSPLYRALWSCSIICEAVIQHNSKLKAKQTKNQNQQDSCSTNNSFIPIIVQPLLSESLRCASDVSYNLFKAKKQFPFYDYRSIDNQERCWYIQNQVQGKRQLYEKLLKDNGIWVQKNNITNNQRQLQSQDQMKIKQYRQTAKFLTKYMQQTHNFESSLDLIQRAEKARQKIKHYYEKYIIRNEQKDNNSNNSEINFKQEQKKSNKKILIISHFYLIGYLITKKSELGLDGKPLSKFAIKNAQPLYYRI